MMNLEASRYQAIGFSQAAFMFDCIRSRGRSEGEGAEPREPAFFRLNQRVYSPWGENTGDRRLRPRGAGRLDASAEDDGRLRTESSVPAFSHTLARAMRVSAV